MRQTSIDEPVPCEVLALGRRLGAASLGNRTHVALSFTGSILKPGRTSSGNFHATQVVDVRTVEFTSRAILDRTRAITVSDTPDGSVIQRDAGGPGHAFVCRSAKQEERRLRQYAMRYLFGLPWIPDAVLCNRSLHWTASNGQTMRVRAVLGELVAEAVLRLDSDGRIGSVYALMLSAEGGSFNIEEAWSARFSSYQAHQGQMIPFACECVHGGARGVVSVCQLNLTDRRMHLSLPSWPCNRAVHVGTDTPMTDALRHEEIAHQRLSESSSSRRSH